MNERKWFLRTQDETFGPETGSKMLEWARMGRIQPGQELSDDNLVWRRVEDVPFLDMRFSIDIGDGNPRGPFNRAAAEALLASGRLPPTSTLIETRAPFEAEPIAAPAEPSREDPPAKVVEKIVEVEKIVVDETRVKELEGLLEEERRHTVDLQKRMDENSKKSSAALLKATEREAKAKAELQKCEAARQEREQTLKDALDRAGKQAEQIVHLEDELKRLPQAASEVADIQAAMFTLMNDESESLAQTLEREKQEFEQFKRLHAERADRLLERRRELLKKAGADIGDMTRKVLAGRPEDPRTIQLRSEFDEYRRLHERMAVESERRIGDLSEQLRICRAEAARHAESQKDLSQLLQENQNLRENLQRVEKELVEARQQSEELRRQQATSQQVLMSRLASLESPSMGPAKTLATNQTREAKMVKLPSWMKLKS